MNVKPYNKMYLEDVSDNLGLMLEYAAVCEFNSIEIWEIFISSKIAMEIEKGNIKYLSGYSGIEYLDLILSTNPVYKEKLSKTILNNKEKVFINDRLYWAGFTLACYQYESGLSFYNINKYLPLQYVLEMYDTLHQADIRKFFDVANIRVKREKSDTNLKLLRKARGLTQETLAKKAEVDLRSIQMYEQRHNDINKAQVDTLYKISKILGCNIEELLELE